jgi:hypothetical protein
MLKSLLMGSAMLALPAHAGTLPEIAPGCWHEIPGSSLAASGVLADDIAGGEGSVNRITAWSSAALDPASSRLYVWGGGHADYAGNEVYAFDLATLRWQRLTDPAQPDRERTDSYGDGTPRSRHTYDYIEYVPAANRLMSFGGAALYPYGNTSTRRISEFDPETRSWITGRRADVPAGGNMIGAHARLDPVSGDVFFLASQRAALARYSIADDRWREGWGRQYVRVHATAAIDPQRRLFVMIGSGAGAPQALKWDLDRPGAATDLRSVTSGDKEIERAYAPGFDFHRPSGVFVAWSGGGDVHVLDPEDWRWTRRKPAPDNRVIPGPQLSTGTHGRFRYVPALDLFVLMNGVERNVLLYRLAPL